MLHIRDIYRDLLAGTGKELHIRYYDKTPNVGDDLNMILISSLQERCTYIQRSGCLPHILGVGSILHFATQKSLVWGSGFISEAIRPKEKVLSEMKVFALRGELSKEVLRPLNADARNCPLGDPAILMPKIYSPTNIQKKFRLGIVPHLADADSPWISVFERIKGVTILRLDQNPILFINRLNECDYIASSSLHGLVLADAYSIPNVRLKLSDRIVGGDSMSPCT